MVNQILYDYQGVCIHTQRQIYLADAVIVTVSIGVLPSSQILFNLPTIYSAIAPSSPLRL
ncbi:hypothetical protein [Nostoc sphaeroides]|uniref:hypothetical protein n=1 Tax=Nostoc sphaeroides TaxID=446679 RepID=UPI001883F6D6|nr:hypothetical protein [Nostoc sphaeroides]